MSCSIENSKQQNKKHALIVAGGTGGHIFPGLAVAKTLQARGWHISWLGSKGGMEEAIISAEKINLYLITIKGLRGNGLLGWLKMPFSLTKAIFESINILQQASPDLVIGFGGFVSGPAGIASFLKKKPLLIHEQNAVAGMTNKYLFKLATQVFQAFPKTFKNKQKLKTVGNPVRQEFLDLRAIKKEFNQQKNNQMVNVLVIGGSRGALAFNKELPKVFFELLKKNNICIHHQVGRNNLQKTEQFYKEANLKPVQSIQLFEFIDDIAEALNWADIVISRAGASTVSEISAVGIAAIFIPYPYAVDDHQSANANWLVKENAALSFCEEKLVQPIFLEEMNSLIKDRKKREVLAVNANKVAYLNAAKEIADYCNELIAPKNRMKDAA